MASLTKVVVFEEDQLLSDLILQTLSSETCQVVAASTAKVAMELVDRLRPDLDASDGRTGYARRDTQTRFPPSGHHDFFTR